MSTKVEKSVATLFGVDSIDESVKVEVRTDQHPNVPTVDTDYAFTEGTVRVMLAWAINASREWPLFLTGGTGVGKSSLAEQTAARLGIPVYSSNANGRMELDELLGTKDLVSGDTYFADGPLTEAYRNGGWFLLDEIDLLEADIATGLNRVAENKPLTLMNGEVIHPHPEFRFVMTGNTNGSGDTIGVFAGTKLMNRAFLERSWIVEVLHLPRYIEEKILTQRFPNLPQKTVDGMLDTAERIRERAHGDHADSMEVSMSTRILKKWGEAMQLLRGVAKDGLSPALFALDVCLGNGCAPETRQALRDIAKLEMGDDLG